MICFGLLTIKAFFWNLRYLKTSSWYQYWNYDIILAVISLIITLMFSLIMLFHLSLKMEHLIIRVTDAKSVGCFFGSTIELSSSYLPACMVTEDRLYTHWCRHFIFVHNTFRPAEKLRYSCGVGIWSVFLFFLRTSCAGC